MVTIAVKDGCVSSSAIHWMKAARAGGSKKRESTTLLQRSASSLIELNSDFSPSSGCHHRWWIDAGFLEFYVAVGKTNGKAVLHSIYIERYILFSLLTLLSVELFEAFYCSRSLQTLE
jgi:hypothetical protein